VISHIHGAGAEGIDGAMIEGNLGKGLSCYLLRLRDHIRGGRLNLDIEAEPLEPISY
jgi:hypothetical protein